MKKLFLLVMAVVGLYSCQNDDATADSSFAMQAAGADYAAASLLPQTTVSGAITSNTTWDNDHVWKISGIVRVTGGTLTIEPGTFVIADSSVSGTTGVLVVSKGGSINAVGLNPDGSCNPIVFTSYNLLDNNDTTTALPGDFGGVVLLGEAPVNTGLSTNVIEGLNTETPVADYQYGGTSSTDNSGVMRYVRIEFAGRIIGDPEAGNEINGLTLGGVGSGTTLNHIQVSYGRDDSFEFFGGTVNATHLIAFAQDDDGFDFDFGYTGSITKAIAIANKNSTHSTSGGNPDSNGIELDNNAGGTVTTLITRPVIKELSIVGLQCPDQTVLENGIHVRRRGQIDLEDATVTGYPVGMRWDSPSLADDSQWGSLSVHAPLEANVILPTATDLGPGNSRTFGCPMETWGLTQPFYNLTGFDLGGNTGAFTSETGWTSCWTKFSGFVTVYE